MEKIITVVVIMLFIALLQSGCFKRTPEKILRQQFNISLKEFDYTVENYKEEWLPNGDGYVLITFKFKELTKRNIDYFKSLGFRKLPVLEKNQIPSRFLFDSGYYLFKKESINDERNFKLFVVDTENKKAILYYQLM